MGNSSGKKDENAEFLKAVKEMNREQNKMSPTLVATNLDKKYRAHLLEQLYLVQIPKLYKKVLAELIEDKISKEDLTAAVALFTALKSNQMTSSILKIKVTETPAPQVSDNVIVKFDERMLRRRKPKNDLMISHFSSGHFEETQQGRVKYTASMITREINKPYHPFRYLCKKFGEILKVDEGLQGPCQSEEEYEVREKYVRKVVTEFCKFLVEGCIGLYKKWILSYTGVEERKYQKWMTSIAINEMWGVSDNSLRDATIHVLNQIKVPLKLRKEAVQKASVHLTPEDFAIDPELRIEGHYFKSIYELSELTLGWKPTQLVKHLETIKNCICLDIDDYHKLAEKGQVYEINGDNIMGIVAYLLCKVASKIDEIYTVLLFLKLVYGDIIFYGLDVGSYMYSTLTGAIEYLESKDFPASKWKEEPDKEEEDLKDTGCESVVLEK